MHRCSVFALALLPLCATASGRHDRRAVTGLEVAVRELVETDRMDRTLDALWHAHDTPNTLRGLRLVGDRPRALAKLERREQKMAKANPGWVEFISDLQKMPERAERWMRDNKWL